MHRRVASASLTNGERPQTQQWRTLAAPGPAPGDVIVERPEGLAGGRFAWPPWAIALVGSLVVLTALVYYLLRVRSGKRR
jgi:hypothetical protein